MSISTHVLAYPLQVHNFSTLSAARHQIAPQPTNHRTFCLNTDAHNAYLSEKAHFIAFSILCSHAISIPPLKIGNLEIFYYYKSFKLSKFIFIRGPFVNVIEFKIET